TEFKSMIQRTDERRLVPAPRLTDRELEGLKPVPTGVNNRDIAKELFISENTVKNHVRNILEKLQLHSRMEAVVYAMREKILEIRYASPQDAAGRGRRAVPGDSAGHHPRTRTSSAASGSRRPGVSTRSTRTSVQSTQPA